MENIQTGKIVLFCTFIFSQSLDVDFSRLKINTISVPMSNINRWNHLNDGSFFFRINQHMKI